MAVIISSILYILIGGALAAYIAEDGDDLGDMALMIIWPILFLGIIAHGCIKLLLFIPRLFRSWVGR